MNPAVAYMILTGMVKPDKQLIEAMKAHLESTKKLLQALEKLKKPI